MHEGSNGGVFKCTDIAIGQGHTGSYNNWWVGGKNAGIHKDRSTVWLECPAVDGYYACTVTIETIEGHFENLNCPFVLVHPTAARRRNTPYTGK
jgi:hypothetical protein